MDKIGSGAIQDPGAASSAPPGWVGLTLLQCELRALFAKRPVNRALAEALRLIGEQLGAEYAVVHARLGVHLLSEDWSKPGAALHSDVRDSVNTILWDAVSNEMNSCTKLHDEENSPFVVAALMYDEDVEQVGVAALVFPDCDEDVVLRNRLCLEGALGCLALLVDGGARRTEPLAERRKVEPTSAADHPVRLALAIATDIKNEYGFDLTAVGFVHRDRVEVMAVSGQDDAHARHPGVQLIRSAMEECLDRRQPVVYSGGPDAGVHEVDSRLHAQWSATLGRDPVASKMNGKHRTLLTWLG